MAGQNGLPPNGPINGNGNGASSSSSPIHPPGPPISDFLMQLEDYTPTIPDSVTQYYLSTAGFDTEDPRIVRLISLAAQKFVSDIANDALQHCKMRGGGKDKNNAGASGGGGSSKKSGDRKFTMTTEDLAQALGDQGITLRKPPYYS